jgi:Cu-Zn family superoxide dismutase
MNASNRHHFVLVSLSLCLALAGCGESSPSTRDSGTGPRDSGTAAADSAAPRDAAPGTDSGPRPDAGGGGSDSGAGGDSGGTGGDSGPGDGGPVARFARADIEEAEGDTGITGTATFAETASGMGLVLNLTSCPDGAHPWHIHEGTGCATREEQGMHWGPARGEGLPDVVCSGGTGSVVYTRDPSDPALAWTIGDGAESDVLGHPIVIHGATDGTERIGCGVITTAP